MTRQIVIDPITRVEGHGKVTLYLDDSGEVRDARLHVTQFRGFEKFCEGCPFSEMPSLTARICGICPVSHSLASAKACDAVLAVQVPRTAQNLRKILNLAQLLQSHALSFFHLSSPDLLLGMDSDPAERNVFGVIRSHPSLARNGIRLRQIGQQMIETLGEKRIHSPWVIPGGVANPLASEDREALLVLIPEALSIIQETIEWFYSVLNQYTEEIRTFANFPTLFLALVGSDGRLGHYDGRMRVIDSEGNRLLDQADPAQYADYIEEWVEPDSYLKSPCYKPMGYPDGIYRVGSLARLNAVDCCGTPRADEAWKKLRQPNQGPLLSSFHYHYARLVESLYAIEQIEEILHDSDILDDRVCAKAQPNNLEGIGAIEAPRGTLIHHYRIDKNGLIVWANLIVATGHNNLAMNRGILQVAKEYVKGDKVSEGILNRVEAVIRSFDPCLSCSTHALGRMSLQIQLLAPTGECLDKAVR